MATNLHKNSDENNKHTPKGFSSASNMDKLLRDEKGESTYTRNNQLPSAINFVDGNAAPPTSVSGNIYVLIDEGNGAVNSAWDGASYNDWVRYDGTLWYAITPENGDFCFDQNAGIYKLFSSSAWADFDNASNIMNTNGLTLLGNYTHDLSTNTLAFNNGSVLLNASSKVASEDILLSGETYIQRASTSSADTVLSLLDNVGTELWDFRANGDVYQGATANWFLNGNNLDFEVGTSLLSFNVSRNSNGFVVNKSGTSGFGIHVEVDNAATSSGGLSIDANSSSFGLSLFSTNGNIMSTYKYGGQDGILIGNGAGSKVRPLSVLGGDNGSNALGSGRYVNAQFGLSSNGIELGFNSTNGGGLIWGRGKEIEIEATKVGVGYQSNQMASKFQVNGDIGLVDGMTAPTATVGVAKLYVDTADGDLKIIFGDGTVKTIVTDT